MWQGLWSRFRAKEGDSDLSWDIYLCQTGGPTLCCPSAVLKRNTGKNQAALVLLGDCPVCPSVFLPMESPPRTTVLLRLVYESLLASPEPQLAAGAF